MIVILIMGIAVFSPFFFLIPLVWVPERRDNRLKREGVPTVGTCLRISWDENSSISKIQYRSVAGARMVHYTTPNYSTPIEPGEEVDMVYDPRRPERAQLTRWLDGRPGSRLEKRVLLVTEGVMLIPQLLWIYVIFYNIF